MSLIETSRDGKTAILTLNRPEKRNALSMALRNEITARLSDFEKDDSISVAVILARGPVFCAGFDTKEFYNRDPEHLAAMRDSSQNYHRRLAEFSKPLIAGIHGPALGGGFDLAALCDIRIGATDASFAHPEIRLGAPVLYAPFKELVGGSLASELAFMGRMINAESALRIGLLSAIVSADQIPEACMRMAQEISESPLPALMSVKRQKIANYGGWEGLSRGMERGGLLDIF